ncbi:MAG: TolC family protein [Oligoflexia bacterium]|nr:TolC family protein [Oligoflexia bacterium]
MKYSTALILSFMMVSPSYAQNAKTLNLAEYLNQVKGQNEGYRAALHNQKAEELLESEGRVDFTPSFTADLSYTDDQKVPASAVYGTKTLYGTGVLGLNTKLRTGTKLGFSHTTQYSETYGSSFVASSGTFNYTPTVSLTQPLWKDFNANLSKANELAKKSSHKANAHNYKYAAQQILYGAEAAYWQLALLKQVTKFDQESIERTEKILQWNQRRVAMNVADRADLLQSQAALKQKQLQYQTDLEIMKQAAAQFNSLRNVRGDQVDEELSLMVNEVEKVVQKEIKRIHQRADVEAKIQAALAQKASANLASESVKPQVDLYGSVSFNGRNTDGSVALNDSWSSKHPTYVAGLKISIPLDVGLNSDLAQGAESAAQAAEATAWRSRFELDQDWVNLQRKYKDAASRLQLATELEKLQEEKLVHERKRFNNGRTTSFQVLQFEDHYSEARVIRLRVLNEIVTLHAQARLYNGESL